MNKFFESVRDHVKKTAQVGDRPMLHINTKEGIVLALMEHTRKYATNLAIEAMRIKFNDPEMVFVTDSWIAKGDKNTKVMPRDNPERKEAFVLGYFSKDKELGTILPYNVVNKKIIFEENISSETAEAKSTFNPYNFKKKEIKDWTLILEQDIMKDNGIKETHELPFKFEANYYSHEGKAFFELINNKKENFISIGPEEDSEEFRKKFEEAIDALNHPEKLPDLIKKHQEKK